MAAACAVGDLIGGARQAARPCRATSSAVRGRLRGRVGRPHRRCVRAAPLACAALAAQEGGQCPTPGYRGSVGLLWGLRRASVVRLTPQAPPNPRSRAFGHIVEKPNRRRTIHHRRRTIHHRAAKSFLAPA